MRDVIVAATVSLVLAWSFFFFIYFIFSSCREKKAVEREVDVISGRGIDDECGY